MKHIYPAKLSIVAYNYMYLFQGTRIYVCTQNDQILQMRTMIQVYLNLYIYTNTYYCNIKHLTVIKIYRIQLIFLKKKFNFV